uniref:Uncharacterized protein n=1 Tax=Lactuca sativa TaxID=4236 RepID=A0A9R1X506_LACSA|nr:hypothetical protein LSAT_V11C600316370 [Lactuca sativa]
MVSNELVIKALSQLILISSINYGISMTSFLLQLSLGPHLLNMPGLPLTKPFKPKKGLGSSSVREYVEQKRAIADSQAESLHLISIEDLISHILTSLDSSYRLL